MWDRVKKILILGAGIAMVFSIYTAQPEEEIVEFRKEIRYGETVWGVCAQTASNRDNLQEVVWRACRDSGIKDAGNVQPGTEIIIKVKKIKSLEQNF